MKLIVQEDIQGCGVACVASLLGYSYKKSLKLFPEGKKRATLTGFYCREIALVLSKRGKTYKVHHIKSWRVGNYPVGTIVYIRKSKKYWSGHYLLKTEEGWMNSWANFPYEPRISTIQKKLPGKVQYVITPI